MLISARMLTQFAGPNIFRYVSKFVFTDGDAPTIYFQLIDSSVDRLDEGFSPAGRRYCPSQDATVQVTFGSIDDAKRITRAASPACPQHDTSIWKVKLLPTDRVAGNADLAITLTDGGQTLRGVVRNAIVAHPLDGSR